MEPFEEVKPEDMYIKPLTRDIYYTKYPDIPRSESEDENSLSLNGFRIKHDEWKTKVYIKRFNAERRNSCNSRLSVSGMRLTKSNTSLNETRRVTSLVVENKSFYSSENKLHSKNNDDKVRDFFKRLLDSVPPPPVEDLKETIPKVIIEPPTPDRDFNEIELPNYAEFEKSKLISTTSESNLNPTTSTLKKSRRSISFNLNTVDIEPSWYESIFGISDLITQSKESLQENTHRTDAEPDKSMSGASSIDCFPSWSDIVNECGINNSLIQSKESLQSLEQIISHSHCENAKIADICQEDRDGYAKFAIYKIHQTYKSGKRDSSSLRDLFADLDDLQNKTNVSMFLDLYSLVPNNVDEIHESVNNVTPECTEL